VSDEPKQIRIQAETFAREHVVECAAELLEWSNTGLLRDGRVRELARTLQQLDEHHPLTLAERFVTRAALERAVQPAQTVLDETGVIDRLAHHIADKRNTAFSRSTMQDAMTLIGELTRTAQTERALTDEQREAIEYGADCIHEKWGETMKAEVTLRALLTAAQPASGADHD
jgi:hypothetical protein